VGRVIGPDERTPEAIRDAVRMVLSNTGYRERAQGMRDEIRALPSPDELVSMIERLVNGADSRRSEHDLVDAGRR